MSFRTALADRLSSALQGVAQRLGETVEYTNRDGETIQLVASEIGPETKTEGDIEGVESAMTSRTFTFVRQDLTTDLGVKLRVPGQYYFTFESNDKITFDGFEWIVGDVKNPDGKRIRWVLDTVRTQPRRIRGE